MNINQFFTSKTKVDEAHLVLARDIKQLTEYHSDFYYATISKHAWNDSQGLYCDLNVSFYLPSIDTRQSYCMDIDCTLEFDKTHALKNFNGFDNTITLLPMDNQQLLYLMYPEVNYQDLDIRDERLSLSLESVVMRKKASVFTMELSDFMQAIKNDFSPFTENIMTKTLSHQLSSKARNLITKRLYASLDKMITQYQKHPGIIDYQKKLETKILHHRLEGELPKSNNRSSIKI